MLICVKSKHGCSSGMMSWNVIVMRLVCKDSNNVDSEIHYFKDGSIPLFCSVDFFGCLQGDITSRPLVWAVHHILSNFMMLLWYCSCGASLYQLFFFDYFFFSSAAVLWSSGLYFTSFRGTFAQSSALDGLFSQLWLL